MFKSIFGKGNAGAKELIERYNVISRNKETDKLDFVGKFFTLMNDISSFIKEKDQNEKLPEPFCNTLNDILKDIEYCKDYLDEESYFRKMVGFMNFLLSYKTEITPELTNLTNTIGFLDSNENEEIDPIIVLFWSNENWIPYIEKKDYLSLFVQKLTNESLIKRNKKILKVLAENISKYSPKKISQFIESLSKLSDKIARDLRYSFSDLLFNIFKLDDKYYQIFEEKSGLSILMNLFKKGECTSINENQAGYEIFDFFCLFYYKEFNMQLYKMIIEDEPNLNGQDEDNDLGNLSEEDLIEKYALKAACIKNLASIVNQVEPDMFKPTREQIVDIHKVQLMNSTSQSFNKKLERNSKLAELKHNFTNSYVQLLSLLRSGIWSENSQNLDKVILDDFWSTEEGFSYLINMQNPTFLAYRDEFFNKFENWNAIYDRMEKSSTLVSLYLLMFTLPDVDTLQTEGNINYLNRLFDIYESRNELFDLIAKTIIKLSFKHLLFMLRNSPNDEIYNEIIVLSTEDCYVNYDISLYSVLLKFSLQFNQKLHQPENFKKLLKIYKIDTENNGAQFENADNLAFVALLLLDKYVMSSNNPEITNIASNIIMSSTFDDKSCTDRLSFRVLQEVDFDLDNAFKVLNSFHPSVQVLPLFISVNPSSNYLNEQFLCIGMDQFDYFTALNILPRSFVKTFIFERAIVKEKSHPSIVTAALQMWPFMHNNLVEKDEFMNYKETIPSLLKNNSTIKETRDICMLILCLLQFNRAFMNTEEYDTFFCLLMQELKSDPNKDFWFSLLLSSHQISSSFLPLPFLPSKDPINTPSCMKDNKLEFMQEMSQFDLYNCSDRTQMTFQCLVPFSKSSFTADEESFSNGNDFTSRQISKKTIHPNKEIIDDEYNVLDFTNWQTFIDTLLLISNQVESKQKEEERQKHQVPKIARASMIDCLIDVLLNPDYKIKVDTNFLRSIFLGNPYTKLEEIEDVLQIFTECFTIGQDFNQVFFEFILDCSIEGWFCERVGAILNSLFGYYMKFKEKASFFKSLQNNYNGKLMLAYKLGFYRITLKEVPIFLCLMREYEKLFFSSFKKDDYFFYHNRIKEFMAKAEEEMEKKEDDFNYKSVIDKCKYTINVLNRKYHEIILKGKPKKKKQKKESKGGDSAKEESNKDSEQENKDKDKEESNEEAKEETNEQAKEENKEEAKENANEEAQEEAKEENKEEAKEENKEEAKEENKEEAKEEAKEENKEEAKEEAQEEAKEENNEQVNNEANAEQANEEAKETASEEAKEENAEEAKEENAEEAKEAGEGQNNEDVFNEEEEEVNFGGSAEPGSAGTGTVSGEPYSTDIFSDADEDEFESFNEPSYEKKLASSRHASETSARKFRIESKKRFDAHVTSIMDFVYREVKDSEVVAENYRKIWFDSLNFDDTLLLRKAEYELEDVLKDKIEIRKSVLKKKELVFASIEVLTGLRSSKEEGSDEKKVVVLGGKLNGVEGTFFFGDEKIVFVEGLGIEGEFEVKDVNYDDDENLRKIVKMSHHFEGHVLFEVMKKDVAKLKVSKSTAEFEYSDISIVAELASEKETNVTKLFSQNNK